MKSVELLSPAGTIKNMRYAYAYGADAVYAGQPRYSLRVRNNDFLEQNLALGIAEAHALGKKFYLATNVLPHNSKIKTFLKDIAPIVAMGPDALIMADPGLIMLVRENWPDMPVHLSVQANTMNYASVKFWQSVGITRIILSRELSLDEIAEIRQQCPDMELETFVHGALCIAYSGRCLLSGYFNHRDPNQGTCTNSCRWKYDTTPATENAEGDIVPVGKLDISFAELNKADCGGAARHPLADQIYLLEEENRPGEFMPVMEDEHGTYIMNSKDLRAVEHVQRLVEIGVDSLKIEGRTKSHYYVARTAQVYRQAIDDALAGHPFQPELLGVLENLAQRGYTDGFYQRHHTHEQQNYLRGYSESRKQQFVGEITGFDPLTGKADVLAKNKFAVGDRLELILPEGNRDIVVEHLEDKNGNPLAEAPGGGWEVKIPLPTAAAKLGLLAKYLPSATTV
ncbi:tRNA 5-hydroxyuridine modification protein YegQ [Methylococcus sp. EFPC2]|uniref:prephenate-dependent tRNA uridine(34) hydroxylase TrhP n=1 Tax=Methylococcus sp. EFPC2 TaxID=2812648 RepID=UPI001967C98C|nr:tRNA 5-hydroxyuridine modification protein YegQ [Methylococcus sp. EFPC2]QSA96772.1 tRNA 5-hydroxyuridine modification protein YegQ [Methylococcus sp. EFPC2]